MKGDQPSKFPTAVYSAIAASRSSGNLNLCGRGLCEVPAAVYDFDEPLPGSETKWWEVSELAKVDLSRNNLESLPEQLGHLPTLTFLDVSCNDLTTLPDSLSQLTLLKSLSVSTNGLTVLPPVLCTVTSLVSLSATSNKLTSLPPTLGANQPRLAVLNLSANALTTLPPSLAQATALLKLDVSANNISKLPSELFDGLVRLTELDLSKNSLSSALPNSIGKMTALRSLWLRENHLTSLPPGLEGCQSLVELHAGSNQLTSVPPELGSLKELRVLDLGANKLEELPDGLCTACLSMLDLRDNYLRGLPPTLGLMTTLRSMPLSGNPLKTLRPALITGPTSSLLRFLRSRIPASDPSSAPPPAAVRSGNVFGQNESQLADEAAKKLTIAASTGAVGGKELLLVSRGLQSIPDGIAEAAPYLQKLDLSCNPLASIPSSTFQGFTDLRSLVLTSTGLSAWPLPPTPSVLPALMELCIGRNPIRSLPTEAFTSCPSLRSLDLAGVPGAGQLPGSCLLQLTQIDTLDLSNTGTSQFHDQFLQLTTLRVLRLEGNRITEIPEAVTNLVRLEELFLANNSLTTLPPAMGLMSPTLRVVTVEGNMFRLIRRAILERGTPALLEYLQGRISK